MLLVRNNQNAGNRKNTLSGLRFLRGRNPRSTAKNASGSGDIRLAQISLQRVQALVSDGRAVRVRGRVDLKKQTDDIDFRKARALAYALRSQRMRRLGPTRTPYDGRTTEKEPAHIAGFSFAVWGTEYSYSQAAPLVREGKRTDAHFRRVLEQDGDPTIVDIVLAQDTLLGIFGQLRPIGVG